MDNNTASQSSQQQKQRQAPPNHTTTSGGKKCFHCGANISMTAEICPFCGRSTNPNKCSFCGNEMDMNDLFCSECGNSRKGIVCPECGTLNFRSFCRNCNHPLDHLAQAEMEKAAKDPVFQRACELQKHIVELEERLLSGTDESIPSNTGPSAHLLAKDKTLANEYQELLSLIQTEKIDNQTAKQQTTNTQQVGQPVKPNANPDALERLSEEYDNEVLKMNELLSNMMPDPGTSPQIQRNYYSARKLPIIGTIKTKQLFRKKIGWVCNYCGYTHKHPSECAEPQLGGTWMYKEYEVEKTVISKTYQYEE